MRLGRRVGALGRRVAALAVAGALVAGCLDQPTATVAPTPTRAPEPTPIVRTYDPQLTVWYEGLVLTFGLVVSELDALGGPVTVAIHVENPGEDLGELDAPIRLGIGDTLVEPTRESHVPSVPAGGTADVVLEYDVQGASSVDAAVIVVGRDPYHLGRVPLTSAGGAAATFEPRTFELRGSGTAGGLRAALRGGLLRWDLPDWSQEFDAGRAALTVRYDITYVGSFPGGYPFTGANIELRLPNGRYAAPRRDGHSQSIEPIGPGKTKADLFSRFEIPSDMYGEFRLYVIDGSVNRAIRFTIKG